MLFSPVLWPTKWPSLLPVLSILDHCGAVLDHQSVDDHFQTPIFFSTIAIVSLDIFNRFFDQSDHFFQSAIDNFIHSDRHPQYYQSIISITAIAIFDHQSINSTIAINFWITSRELILLSTDMASHKHLPMRLISSDWKRKENKPLTNLGSINAPKCRATFHVITHKLHLPTRPRRRCRHGLATVSPHSRHPSPKIR